MIKTWIFDFIHIQGRETPWDAVENPAIVQRAFDETLDRLVGAEANGFEGVFFSEHHFTESISTAPNLMVAALSRLTKRIRIGVMGNVLPFHQPWRLAEDLGTLDHLTKGRLEIGMGSGVPMEFPYVNIAQEDVRPMYAEIQEILRLASADRVVTFKGKYFNLDEVPLLPRLLPEPRRRHWVTLYSEATARTAARMEHKICTAYVGCDKIRQVVDAYHDEAAKHGLKTGPDDVGLRRQVLICDSDSQAAEMNDALMEPQRKIMAERFKRTLARLARDLPASMPEGVRKTGTIDAASVGREAARQGKDPLAEIISMEDEYIHGSPKTVAEKIVDQCRRAGGAHLLTHHSPALTWDETRDQYERLWPETLKIIGKADVRFTHS